MRIILILSLIVTLSACSANKLWEGPVPHSLPMDVPGPPEYKAGYKDGCQSGLATYGPAQYKLYYSFFQDYEMLSNKYYNAAWHESFNYCRHFSLKYHQDGGDTDIFTSNVILKAVPKMLGFVQIHNALVGQKTPFFLDRNDLSLEGYSPDYKQGFGDGCNTGLTVYGDLPTKSTQLAHGKSFVRDTTKVGNRAYESAWIDAYHYCRQHANTQNNNWDSDWWGIWDLK